MSEGTQSETRFTRHGPIRVTGTHLAHADGTPFFFLADTAWNGALLASDADWRFYLADRAARGFTAIQFIAHAPWSAALTDEAGDTAFAEGRPRFFARMRNRVEAIVQAGLLPVPVLAWAAKSSSSTRLNPGVSLGARELEDLIRAELDCLQGLPALLLLAGDGKYGGLRSLKWRRLGNRLFGGKPHVPVGLHPMGMTWPYRSFKNCGWLDVVGYQSSHSDSDATLRWLREGPPATQWRQIDKPFINLEPCYEGIHNWGHGGLFTNAAVRHAMYASLLNAPTAGVSYGAHGIWSWEAEAREPLNHAGTGVALPWRQAVELPGSNDVARLARMVDTLPWWTLRPAPARLVAHRGSPTTAPSCSANASGDLIAYLPQGATTIAFRTAISSACWFDPRTAERIETPASATLTTPTEEDWVLIAKFQESGSMIA